MNKFFKLIFFVLCVHSHFTEVSAYYDPPKCYEELPLLFFNPYIVNQALSLHNVWQSEWTPIDNLLLERVKTIPQLVRDRSDHMRPSPLEHPFQPIPAYKLMFDAMFNVFHRVLIEYENYRFNANDIVGMFYYIREQQYPELVKCFGKEVMDEIDNPGQNQAKQDQPK